MVEFIHYSKGKYLKGKDFNYKFSEKNKDDFLCLFVEDPTHNQIQRLCTEFDIQEKHLQKFGYEKRSVRYSFDPLIFGFIDYVLESQDKIRVSHLLFFVKRNVLILAVSEKSTYYRELFHEINYAVEKKKVKNINYILYEFLHRDAKENYDVIESVDDRISALEKKVIAGIQDDKVLMQEIMSIKRYLISMSKRLWASSKIIFTIKKDLTVIKLKREESALLDDIYDTLLHQVDLIETQKDTVTDFLEIFTTTISNKLATTSNELNIVMKKMTALTIIIMVPTLIAGIYGTNFHFFPEITWYYGYLFFWGAMCVSALAVYLTFHKKGWI